jgi:carbon dioxide concentrating mechanism protein CcmN
MGDICLYQGVVLAPGVVLCADPESRIVVESGACLGMGCVIHAQGGTIHICAGASLGAGVLVVGHGVIGTHSCIGAAASLHNPDVAAGATIAPYSILVMAEGEVASNDQKALTESPAKAFARSQLQILKGKLSLSEPQP